MWYEHSTWRNLIDMHIPDWNEDFLKELTAEGYVEAMAKGHPDTALVYTGSCLGNCYWPTRAGHMHEGLKGQDFIRDVCREVKKRKMDLVLYYNIWSRRIFDEHPDWRIRDIEGYDTCNVPGAPSRFGQLCLNSRGHYEYVKAQIRDICENYECDGLWIDMIGWFDNVCFCPDCRRRFMEETGNELPDRVDWRDPVFVRFQRLRERWITDFAKMIRETAESVRPGITLALQCASWPSGWRFGMSQPFFDCSDYLAGDFYSDPLNYSVICKYLTSLSKHRPIEFMSSRCISLEDHTTTKTDAELLASARGAFAHQAAFVYIDAIDPSGRVNERFHQHMGALRKQVSVYEKHISHTAELVADAAVYMNQESMIHPEENGKSLRERSEPVNQTERMTRIARTLIDAHISYDMIGAPQLSALSRWPLIILSEQYVLSDTEAEAFRAYVRRGGHLLVSGETGLYSPEGIREDFALRDVLGVSYEGDIPEDIAYMSPEKSGKKLFAGFDERYPLYLPQQFRKVRVEEKVRVLASVVLPWSRRDETVYFGSAISNPPRHKTELPAVTVNRFGRGSAMYLCAALEMEEYSSKREIFSNLVKYLVGQRKVEAEAPKWLEILVYRDDVRKKISVTCMNSLPNASDLIARDVKISLSLPEKVRKVYRVETGRDLSFTQENGRITFTMDEFTDFAMADLDLEESPCTNSPSDCK